jgi:hypothetical protein
MAKSSGLIIDEKAQSLKPVQRPGLTSGLSPAMTGATAVTAGSLSVARFVNMSLSMIGSSCRKNESGGAGVPFFSEKQKGRRKIRGLFK